MDDSKTRTIKVDYLARVEGEGSLFLKITGGKVEEAKLKIFEPPRFFEAFLKGRMYSEVPDITARICGICPVAYQMSAVYALENAFGVEVSPEIHDLRRVLYAGEWIESHVLHIYMLHAPDFLGFPDAIAIAKVHREVVQMGLRLKKVGNTILEVLGGRQIHPINVRVGGFYRLPELREFDELRTELDWAYDAALKTIDFVSGFNFPDFERDYNFVCLKHPTEYPLSRGQIVSSSGMQISHDAYEEHFEEIHVSHSNALHSTNKDFGTYFVGPMARFHNCFDQLPADCQKMALSSGLGKSCKNPFKSIIVRAIEVLFAVGEARSILARYNEKAAAQIDTSSKVRASSGTAATEAPRGILWHKYDVADTGHITYAKIVPPTSQNQKVIEEDLYEFAPQHISDTDEVLTHKLEQAVRNYDPCISCATHFLNLDIQRT
jgi:coenzyme F420-reducing hydrogenase alpha subunit